MSWLSPRNVSFVVTLAACLAADQLTKAWVVANLVYLGGADLSFGEAVSRTLSGAGLEGIGEVHLVPGWFSFVHAQNTGAAFSTMEGQLALFLVFTVVAVLVVLDMVRRQARDLVFVPFTLGMILSGALGNGIDRARQAHVTDFLKVYAGEGPLRAWCIEQFGTNVWPIFNVADSALLVGVALFLGYWLVQREGEPADDPVDAATPEAPVSG